MNIAICDDDPIFGKELEKELLLYFNAEKEINVDIFLSARSLIEKKTQYDILFLDIEMPDINGVEAGHLIAHTFPETLIFVTTAYPNYLDDAFRMNAFRYFTKPIDASRLHRNLDDAIEKLSFLHNTIFVETSDGVYSQHISNITYLELVNRKAIMHTVEKTYSTIHDIRYYDRLLPTDCFFHVYKNCVVNFQKIKRFDRLSIYLETGEQISLARRRYMDFKSAYFRFLERRI